MQFTKRSNRRDFLRTSMLGGMASAFFAKTGFASPLQDETPKKPHKSPKVKEYRTLGRTGWKISDISSGAPRDEGVLRYLLDSGVNYIDTAESYGGGNNEKMIAEVMKDRNRKDVFITSKLQIKEDKSKEQFIERSRKCLERLKTDYIDCMMIHSCKEAATLATEGFHEAMDELKREGRIRFIGVSNHGTVYGDDIPESMESILLAAAADGRFDVMLLTYNFLNEQKGRNVLAECGKKNIGTTIMKSNPVGKYYSFKARLEAMEEKSGERYEYFKKLVERAKSKAELSEEFIKKYGLENPDEISNAATRYVLSNENVSTICLAIETFEDASRFLQLSGTKLSSRDQGMLRDYERCFGDLYCRHSCGLCEPSCPHGVPVNTIMRYNHYFEAQSREKEAMQKYASLPTARADRCMNCAGYCESSCPYGVPAKGLLCMSHERLTLA
jgi:predicted aldo/keto reductase-like oxidoreductase